MAELSEKVREALMAATTAQEAATALAAGGIEATEEEAQKALAEVKARTKVEDEELSADELAAVAGGSDRDWLTQGCAATVEPGSWCWSNDECYAASVTYDNPPTRVKCPNCGGQLYMLNHNKFFATRKKKCAKCGAEFYHGYGEYNPSIRIS